MYPPLRLRALTDEEARVIGKRVRSQTASVRLVHRARIVHVASPGKTSAQSTAELGCAANVVRKWFQRFEQQGLAGVEDAPRAGAPPRSSAEDKACVLQAARTRPAALSLPDASWTFERLAASVQERLGLPIQKTRSFAILPAEGLRWRHQETGFGQRLDPAFVANRGRSRASGEIPPNSVIVDRDEMGPVAAKRYPGQQAVAIAARPAQRAPQELDEGRRAKGSV